MTEQLTGRALDAAIAERIFGIPTVWDNGILYRKPDSPRLKPSTWIQHYQANMADAWSVAEWIRAQTGIFQLTYCGSDAPLSRQYSGEYWECIYWEHPSDWNDINFATAKTPSEAICHAALALKERMEAGDGS